MDTIQISTKIDNKFIIQRRIFSYTSVIFLILIMFQSSYVSFFWYGRGPSFFALYSFFFICRIPFYRFSLNKYFCLSFLCITLCYITTLIHSNSIIDFASCFYKIVFIFLVLQISESEKEYTIKWITNIFAVLIGIGLIIFFLVNYLNINLPHSIIKYPDTLSSYADFNNYFFVLISNQDIIVHRFQSIFSEPGHLGMICSFILYLNKFNLKRINIILILLGLIMSLSLAAYLLLIIGIILFRISKSKNIMKMFLQGIVTLSIFISIGFFIATYYKNTLIYELIIERLEYDDDKGIVGNNRNSDYFEYYYDSHFYKNENWLLGIGNEKMAKANIIGKSSSYKFFIVKSGILSIILLFLFYLSIACKEKSWYIFGFLLLYLASFLQRPYALWEIEFILFICATAIQQKNKKTLE